MCSSNGETSQKRASGGRTIDQNIVDHIWLEGLVKLHTHFNSCTVSNGHLHHRFLQFVHPKHVLCHHQLPRNHHQSAALPPHLLLEHDLLEQPQVIVAWYLWAESICQSVRGLSVGDYCEDPGAISIMTVIQGQDLFTAFTNSFCIPLLAMLKNRS